MSTEIAKKEEKLQVQTFDLNQEAPDLSKAKEASVELTSAYWTPKKEGEFKNCFYQGIIDSNYVSPSTGESIQLPCAIFVSQQEDKKLVKYRNGSKRLVGALQDLEEAGTIKKGFPMKITYKGKVENKKNEFKSDSWSIVPLIVNENKNGN